MVTRDPSQGSDTPTRAMPTSTPGTGTTTGTGRTTDASTTSTTYSPRTDVTGYGSTQDDPSMTERAGETVEHARETVSDVAGQAKQKAGDAMHAATDAADAQRDTVAGGLDTVATQLRDRAEMIPGGDRTTQIAETAARRLEGASDYLREHEVADMKGDLERFVRSHPTESLVVALAAGFLVGRMIKG